MSSTYKFRVEIQIELKKKIEIDSTFFFFYKVNKSFITTLKFKTKVPFP